MNTHNVFWGFTLLCILLFASCHSNSSVEEAVNEETVNITFNGFSVSDGSLSDLQTRAAEEEANYSLLVVDVKDGKYIQNLTRIQVPSSEALADVTLPLRVGKHKVYFLCCNKPWHNFDESSLLVSWNEQTSVLGDVWSTAVNVDVKSGDAQSHPITLKRAVALVRMLIADAIPEGVVSFRPTLVGGSWTYNLVQQSGDVAAQITRLISVTSSFIGKTDVGTGIYTFIPSGASMATSFSVAAFNASGDQIQNISFSNVPLFINRYTTYKGNYFGYDTGFKLTLDTGWDEENIYNF